MNFSSIRQLAKQDLLKVEHEIGQALHSDVPLIPTLSRHLIQSGGKRLRPLITVLGAQAFGYQGENAVKLAASLELIHAATLLHDDVIDHSDLRRNKPTANALWGNSASVLVGDFLYSRAFQLMVEVQNWPVLASLATVSNRIVEGEILQLAQCYNMHLEEKDCLETIRAKTGLLFATAAIQGALLSQCTPEVIQAMNDYGMYLGIAFQLVDDALDYSADPNLLGKNKGDDLAEGKITLPLLYAIKNGTAEQTTLIQKAIEHNRREDFEKILTVIESTGAIRYTYKLAKQYADQAADVLQAIPPSIYRDALSALTAFVVDRTF
jgi:octaprenyl-diphosphate synthase